MRDSKRESICIPTHQLSSSTNLELLANNTGIWVLAITVKLIRTIIGTRGTRGTRYMSCAPGVSSSVNYRSVNMHVHDSWKRIFREGNARYLRCKWQSEATGFRGKFPFVRARARDSWEETKSITRFPAIRDDDGRGRWRVENNRERLLRFVHAVQKKKKQLGWNGKGERFISARLYAYDHTTRPRVTVDRV